MILSIYRYVQRRPWLGLFCFVAQVIGGQLFLYELKKAPQSPACQELGYVCVPDLMMGMPFDLNHLYDIWTPELHKAYVRGSMIDFCLIMPGFTLTLGAALVRAAPRLGITEYVAHLATMAFLADIGETYLTRYGSIIYPNRRLPEMMVRIASLAGQSKWITCYVAVLVIVTELLFSRRAKTAKMS